MRSGRRNRRTLALQSGRTEGVRLLRFCGPAVTLFVAVAIHAHGMMPPPFKYAHRSWGVGQGMPQLTVECIAQDHAGYLWAGTQDGIVRFDGVRFTDFNNRNVARLGGDWVQSIHVARDGTLWFTNGGLVRVRNGVFLSWPERSFPGSLRGIAEGADGSLWLASNRGAVHFRNGAIRTYGTADGLANENVTSVLVDAAGLVWLATPAGVFRSNGQRFQRVALPAPAGESANIVVRGRNGTILIATNSRIIRFDRGRFTVYPLGAFGERRIRAVHEDSKGALRVGFAFGGGIARFDGTRFVSDPANDSVTDSSIHSIYEDGEGILWVGTAYGGLNQFRTTPFTTYGPSDGLAGRSTLGVFADRSGGVWIGTAGQGLARYADGRFRSYGKKDGLAQGFVYGFEEDAQGAIWIAFLGGGAQRFHKGRFSSITTENGLLSDFVSDLHFDQGTMWIATTKGLTAFEKGRFRHYTERDGLASVTKIAGRNDRLWIGTSAGLYLLDRGRITKTPVSGRILELSETENGSTWVGAVEQGLWRIRQGKFTHYSVADGLFDDSLNSILEDGLGHLWLSSNRGISRVLVSDLDEFDRSGKKFYSESFSTADGMVSPETNTAAPGMVLDQTGRLWIATTHGVAVVDPAALKRRPPPGDSVVPPSSPIAASTPMTVQQFFWQTISFRAACALLVVALPFLLFRVRTAL